MTQTIRKLTPKDQAYLDDSENRRNRYIAERNWREVSKYRTHRTHGSVLMVLAVLIVLGIVVLTIVSAFISQSENDAAKIHADNKDIQSALIMTQKPQTLILSGGESSIKKLPGTIFITDSIRGSQLRIDSFDSKGHLRVYDVPTSDLRFVLSTAKSNNTIRFTWSPHVRVDQLTAFFANPFSVPEHTCTESGSDSCDALDFFNDRIAKVTITLSPSQLISLLN